MIKLLKFHMLRLLDSRKIYLILFLIIIIALSGVILNEVFYSEISNFKTVILSLYNSFTQFFFLIFSYVLVSYFADDIQRGCDVLFSYIGISSIKFIFSKMIIIFLVCCLFIDSIFAIVALIYRCNDANYLIRVIGLLDLCIAQVVALACALSVLIKNTTYASATMYGIFLVSNIVNLIGFGLGNQADGNSLSSYVVSRLSGVEVKHFSLSCHPQLDDGFFGLFCAFIISVVWIVVLLIFSVIFIKRRYNEV